jgi:invasion protein IalB
MTMQKPQRQLAIFLLTLLAGSFVSAQEAGQASVSERAFGDWRLRCLENTQAASGRVCELVTRLEVPGREGDSTLETELILRRPEPANHTLTLRLPNYVWLPEGVSLRTPRGREIDRMEFLLCQEDFCDAATELGRQEMESLRALDQRASLVYEVQSGERITAEFSMRGFAEALTNLYASEAAERLGESR